MKKILLLVALAVVYTCGSTKAQTVIAAELQDELSTQLLGITFPFINIEYAVNTYRVVYTGQDAMGQPDTLSGLVGIPQNTNNPQFPIAVYNHATIFTEADAPSIPGAQERALVNAFTTSGYITLAPDYLGYGEDADELHPYLHRASEAQAAKDMVVAVRAWLVEQDIAFNDQLFTTGYSQGGHSSASFHQLLETENDPSLQITAAAHMAGPYIISFSDRLLINDNSLPSIPVYLVFRFLGYNLAYGWYDSNAALFAEPYLATIDSFANGQTELEELNNSLFSQMTANEDGMSDLFQDSILAILATNDPAHPIVRDVADNDVFAWVPAAPTRLYYCTADMTVPPAVALFTDSTMNALGAPDVASVNAGNFDHLACVIPAALGALAFFDQFAQVISSVDDLTIAEPQWQISPNPVGSGQLLQLRTGDEPATGFRLLDVQGRQLAGGSILADGRIQLPDLAQGYYLLQLYRADRIAVRKIIIE
ncbi:MAG: T9SS type A sorting domain-containing protein [Bacteroidota bacterium]